MSQFFLRGKLVKVMSCFRMYSEFNFLNSLLKIYDYSSSIKIQSVKIRDKCGPSKLSLMFYTIMIQRLHSLKSIDFGYA